MTSPPGSAGVGLDGTPLSVADVRVRASASRLKRPFITSQRRTEFVEYVVVEVELSDGSVGQGTAAESLKVTGETVPSMTAAIEKGLAPELRGATGNIVELAALLPRSIVGNTSAKAAVDVALHDAWARSLDRPLAELLGGSVPASLVHDMTVSLDDPATMADHAREAVADGYRLLKIKLGRDAALDEVRLRTVVEAAPGVRLRLDANQGWTPEEALRIIERLVGAGLPVDLLEQPVPKHDLAGLAAVTQGSPIPIMADEALWSVEDAHRIADAGAAHLFNIKLAKTGGLQQALAIADVAAEAGLECMVGEMMEPRISTCAAAHLAVAHPAVTMIDLDSPEWFVDNVPAGGYETVDGELRLTGGPGLGMERLQVQPRGVPGVNELPPRHAIQRPIPPGSFTRVTRAWKGGPVGIEAVIFDWGGTLTPWHVIDERQQWERFAAGYGTMACSRNELTGALLQQWHDASARHRTEHRSTRLAEMLDAVGAQAGPATDAGLAEYYEWWVPHGITRPDVEPTLVALRERGLRIGVLSNTIWPPQAHREIFERDGIAHLIDADLYSSELEHTKPHPSVFAEMCRRIEVNPANAVYVGDRLFEDVWGAQQAGMRAIWVPGSQFHEHDQTESDATPDAIAHDLGDVVTIIDGLE